MKKRAKHWTELMYIDNARRWVHWMNKGSKAAPRIARQIMKVLKKHGVVQGRILELGCGNGRIAINMAKLGFDVTGVDISRFYLDEARRKAARGHLKAHFVHGDIRTLRRSVRGKFDVAISIWTSLGYYDKPTDERIFLQVGQLLRKKGIFLILFTMSRERLLSIFNPHGVEETDKYVGIIKNTYDSDHSILNNRWIFYRKAGKDLIYEDEVDCRLRIYGLHEFVEMAEKAGFGFKEAYDSIMTLEPARPNSVANLVFEKA